MSLLCIMGIHRWTVVGQHNDGTLMQQLRCMRCHLSKIAHPHTYHAHL
jgi:hypothetical protein